MKFNIDTDKKSLEIIFSDQEWSEEVIAQFISIEATDAEPKKAPAAPIRKKPNTNIAPERSTRVSHLFPEFKPKSYSWGGLMLIECSSCKKRKIVYAADKTNTYYCRDCKDFTSLNRPLYKIQAKCKCGNETSMRTNLEALDRVTSRCNKCGSTVSGYARAATKYSPNRQDD